MKTSNDNRRSRILAYILRHDKKAPIKHGGWISVDYLISEKEFSYKELVNIVLNDEKMRFEFNDDQTLIRALYGHSVPVDLGLMCKIPPVQLYHGTYTNASVDILDSGLLPRSRNFVHLSDDKQRAIEVGQRHGDPLVVCINTVEMIHDGYHFYNPIGHTWLVSKVPSQYFCIESHSSVTFDEENFDEYKNEFIQVVCPEELSENLPDIQLDFKLAKFSNGIMSFDLGDWMNSGFYIIIDDGSIIHNTYEYLRTFREHVHGILILSQKPIEGLPYIIWNNVAELTVIIDSVISMVSGHGRLQFDFRDIETMLLQYNNVISFKYVEFYADADIRVVKELFNQMDFISAGITTFVIQIQKSPCINPDYKLSEILNLISEGVSGICHDCEVLWGYVNNPQLKNNYRISIYYH